MRNRPAATPAATDSLVHEPEPVSHCQVLFVGGDAALREAVLRHLAGRCEVRAASGGEAALAAARERTPDLLLVEAGPGPDGRALLAALRADPATRGAAVAALLPRSAPGSAEDGLEDAADDLLFHPWSARELHVRVSGLLARTRERREAIRREEGLLAAARAATEHLETVLASLGDAFMTLDREERFTYVNERMVEMIGRPREELLGRRIWDLFPEAVGNPFHQAVQQVLAERRAIHLEHFYLPWDRWIDNRLYPGADGGVANFAVDITERKRAVEDLRRAKQAAEEASAAKDRFLATLSHELRTPLAPVLAVVSSLERDARLRAELGEKLVMVRRNVELEARLIDDLLDLTRIARGKLELHREVVDVQEIVAHAAEICCGHEVTAGRLRLVLELAAGDHRVWADGPRLSQVFWNLLSNAAKFTGDGGTIRIRSRIETAGPASRLVVEVADTGLGIEPDLLPRIFDGFEQGERSITRRFGGLGLGLAISKAIVEMHGGRIRAESAGRGQGATFSVELPHGLPAEAAAAPAPGATATAATAEVGERPLHILLIEDHADTAEAMADLLALLGHRVTLAGSVAEGLARAGEQGSGLDLVVSDLGLPDGSGLDLMRELAARWQLPGIALSGYGMDEDVRKSREAGFARHLTKPVSLQALEAAIREVGGRG